ncbi:MAG: NAD(+)/NADH kinase [Pseudomonadales bacterium]|nr:NAD(+)/NADH kinase [Pseudomonadales bacterium]
MITVIGGQGHILGRGNQQLSPRVLRTIGIVNIIIIAGEAKLNDVNNVLVVDTGDLALDRNLCGYRRVINGYESSVLCKVVS